VVNAPARDASDFGMTNNAEAALLLPEKAKSMGTPKRVQHGRTFPIFEIGFIGRVVKVGFAFDFYVSFDGVRLAWCSQTWLGCPRHHTFHRRRTSHDHDAAQNTSRS
jgi:hypothetical protein